MDKANRLRCIAAATTALGTAWLASTNLACSLRYQDNNVSSVLDQSREGWLQIA